MHRAQDLPSVVAGEYGAGLVMVTAVAVVVVVVMIVGSGSSTRKLRDGEAGHKEWHDLGY